MVLDGGFGAVHTSKQQLLAIAPTLGVRPRTEPLRVPVTLGYLPPGWSIDDLTFGDAGQLGPQYPSVSIDLRQGGNTITFTMSKLKPGTVEPNIHRQAGDYWLSCFAGLGDVDPTLAGKILDSAKLASPPGRRQRQLVPGRGTAGLTGAGKAPVVDLDHRRKP